MTRDRLLALLLPPLLALAVVLPGITAETFIHEDEWRNASMVREMAASPTLFPSLHGKRYPDYPPLYFWLAAAAQGLGASSDGPATMREHDGAFEQTVTPGVPSPTPFALRWPAALGAALTAFGTALLGLRLGSARLGRTAGLLAAVIPGLVTEERRAMIDPLLVGWTTVALALLASSGREPDEEIGARAGRFALGALALALGWLTKGPLAALVVGLGLAGGEGLRIELAARQTRGLLLRRLVPALLLLGAVALAGKIAVARGQDSHTGDLPRYLALGLTLAVLAGAELVWLAWTGREERPGDVKRLAARAGLIALAAVLVAGAWFGAVFALTDRDFARNLLLTQTLGRVSGEIIQHAKPWHYFLQVLPITLPVGLFALQGAWLQIFKQARSRAGVFALGGFVLLFAFFSWSHTKRSYYLMPAYPLFALLAACVYESVAREKGTVRATFRGVHVALFAVLALAAAACPIVAVAVPELRERVLCAFAGAVFGLYTFATLVLRERLAWGLVSGSAFVLATALPLAAPFVARAQGHRAFVRDVLAAGVDRAAIACGTGGIHREALCWELAPDATHGLADLPELVVDGKGTGKPDPAAVLAHLARFAPGKAAVLLKRPLPADLEPGTHRELVILASESSDHELAALGRR